MTKPTGKEQPKEQFSAVVTAVGVTRDGEKVVIPPHDASVSHNKRRNPASPKRKRA